MSVFFNGRLLTTPTVETIVNDGGLNPQNATVGNNLALIGLCQGGIPRSPTVIRNIAHARQVLRGGELLWAVEKAFASSVDVAAPGSIYAVRVNPATQATKTLQGGSPLANVLTLKSTDYGSHTNSVQIKIEAGSVKGLKVTTQQGKTYYTQDNLARDAFTIRYTGAETTGTVTVTEGTVVLIAGAVTTTIQLSDFPTVQRLVERLMGEVGWTTTINPGVETTAALRGLDGLTAVDAKAAAVTVTANLQAVIDWINSAAEDLITAERPTGALKPPATTDFVYLTGAIDGVSTNTDWAACFDALQAQDVQWLAPLSETPAVWGMADSHCHFMSNMGKKERRCFVGAGSGLDLEQAAADAGNLNSDRTSYVYPAFYDYNSYGQLVLMPAYLLAGMCAAAFASMPPGEPLTNKSLRIAGLELPIAAPSDTDYLIRNGVFSVYQNSRGGFRIAKSISTWRTNDNYNRVEVSTGVALDYTVRSVRERLESFVGKKGTHISIASIVESTASVLRLLTQQPPFGLGLLAGDEVNPSFRNLTAEIRGDVVTVQFECSPVVPINYILISIYANAYTGIVNYEG
jgi:hypothetical protein